MTFSNMQVVCFTALLYLYLGHLDAAGIEQFGYGGYQYQPQISPQQPYQYQDNNYPYYPYQQTSSYRSSYGNINFGYPYYPATQETVYTKQDYLKSGGGYGHQSAPSYVPVVKKTKKKQKIISIDKGLHVAGGTQAFGKFKSLKSCMKACASAPNCFAGDYNPWLGRCYFHSNQTACGTMSAHSKLTHFKKVPCTVPDTTKYQVNLGSQLYGGIQQKGIKTLTDCLKKCVNAGSGLAPTPTALISSNNGGQLCFAIDYDFSSHKCYFHTRLYTRTVEVLGDDGAPTGDVQVTLPLCPTGATAIQRPIDLVPNSGVVNIIMCPA